MFLSRNRNRKHHLKYQNIINRKWTQFHLPLSSTDSQRRKMVPARFSRRRPRSNSPRGWTASAGRLPSPTKTGLIIPALTSSYLQELERYTDYSEGDKETRTSHLGESTGNKWITTWLLTYNSCVEDRAMTEGLDGHTPELKVLLKQPWSQLVGRWRWFDRFQTIILL